MLPTMQVVSETKFDCKKLGAEMLTDGFDLNAEFDQMNKTWAEARQKLNLQ